MLVHRDKVDHFISFFDETNGTYIRSNVFKDGKETLIVPFMSDFPELIDVGILGHCIHDMSGKCMLSNVQCYQNGLNQYEENISLDDFKNIVHQCQGRVFQFALGGRGDPD